MLAWSTFALVIFDRKVACSFISIGSFVLLVFCSVWGVRVVLVRVAIKITATRPARDPKWTESEWGRKFWSCYRFDVSAVLGHRNCYPTDPMTFYCCFLNFRTNSHLSHVVHNNFSFSHSWSAKCVLNEQKTWVPFLMKKVFWRKTPACPFPFKHPSLWALSAA